MLAQPTIHKVMIEFANSAFKLDMRVLSPESLAAEPRAVGFIWLSLTLKRNSLASLIT